MNAGRCSEGGVYEICSGSTGSTKTFPEETELVGSPASTCHPLSPGDRPSSTTRHTVLTISPLTSGLSLMTSPTMVLLCQRLNRIGSPTFASVAGPGFPVRRECAYHRFVRHL